MVRHWNGVPVPLEVREDFVTRYLKGHSATKIAAHYRVSINTVTKYLARAGVITPKILPPRHTDDTPRIELERINRGHSYAEILAAAAKRGNKAAQYYLGGKWNSE